MLKLLDIEEDPMDHSHSSRHSQATLVEEYTPPEHSASRPPLEGASMMAPPAPQPPYAPVNVLAYVNDNSMYQQINPVRVTPQNNLIVNYLPPDVTSSDLRRVFEVHGPLVSVKVVSERATGKSMGYGFVRFHNSSDAAAALEAMSGMQIGNKRIKVVSIARPSSKDIKGSKLYVTHLPEFYGQEQVLHLFSPYGAIIECRSLVDRRTGLSRCTAFVQFDKRSEAKRALVLNGATLEGGRRSLLVKFAEQHQKAPGRGGWDAPVAERDFLDRNAMMSREVGGGVHRHLKQQHEDLSQLHASAFSGYTSYASNNSLRLSSYGSDSSGLDGASRYYGDSSRGSHSNGHVGLSIGMQSTAGVPVDNAGYQTMLNRSSQQHRDGHGRVTGPACSNVVSPSGAGLPMYPQYIPQQPEYDSSGPLGGCNIVFDNPVGRPATSATIKAPRSERDRLPSHINHAGDNAELTLPDLAGLSLS
ncbi:unnamed protein product [Chrysoparadoxa australica]